MKWLHLNSSIDNLISKRDIAGLIKAVNNRNAAISTKAVEALIEIGDLISLLKDCDETTRLRSIHALGNVGTSAAVRSLTAFIISPNSLQEKDEAIIALGKIKNVQSIQQLHFAKYMFESFPKTPGKATEILRSIGEKNENAIPILIETLSSNFIGFRKQAAESLGEIGGNQSILPLMKALKDSDKSVRLSAALALGQIGDPVAIKNIVFAAASDWDEHLANTKGEYLVALEGIVKNNATAVYSYLSELINHENSNVRKIVLDQLYRINSDKSFNYLLIP